MTTQNARLLEGNTSAVPMPSGKPELVSSAEHKTRIVYCNREAAHVLRKVVLGGVEGKSTLCNSHASALICSGQEHCSPVAHEIARAVWTSGSKSCNCVGCSHAQYCTPHPQQSMRFCTKAYSKEAAE